MTKLNSIKTLEAKPKLQNPYNLAQSAGAVKYSDCISAKR